MPSEYLRDTEKVRAIIEAGLADIKDGLRDDAFDAFYNAMKASITGKLSPAAYRKAAKALQDTARKQANNFVTRMTKTEIAKVQQVIADGLQEGLGTHAIGSHLKMVTGLDSIREAQLLTYARYLEVNGFSQKKVAQLLERKRKRLLLERRRTIAQTEARFATAHAREVEAKERGAKFKVWMTVGDDRVSEECRNNQAAGPIPIKQAFPSGEMTPPAHPNCRCTISYHSVKADAVLIHREIEEMSTEEVAA